MSHPGRTLFLFLILVIAGIVGAIVATNTGQLLFNTLWPVLILAPFAGLLVAGRTKRHEVFIDGDRVLRHDGAARLEHWTHALGTTALIITGALLGVWFMHSALGGGKPTWLVMNLHYVAAWFFLFGTFYYLGDTIISFWRLKDHLPTKNLVKYSVQHYGHLLGIKKYSMPPEEKFYESEKLAFIIAVLAAAVLVITGIVKVLAHAIHTMPAGFMHAISITHDLSAILIALFLLAHLFFGVIIPSAWPGLHSMLSGYMSVDEARKGYPGWFAEISKDSDDKSSNADQ